MTETPPPAKEPLTPLRWFFAIVGGLLVVFAGGCGLFYTSVGFYIWVFENDGYASTFILLGLVLGGIPALFGFAIWWVAVKRGRRRVGEEEVVPPG